MENLKISYNNPEMEIVKKAADILNRGGAVVFPTDTVYGLAVNALKEHAVERLFKIKKRPESKPVPVIVRNIAMAKKIAFVNSKTEKVLKDIWPGAVTAVLEKKGTISLVLTGGKRTVGLRIPDCKIVQLLMAELDYPITATSANFSGEPPIRQADEIIDKFGKVYPRPDLFLNAGDLPENSPSTVLDLTGSKPKILRIGPITKKDLMKMIK